MELSLVKEKKVDPLLRKVSMERVQYANNSKEKLNKKAMIKQDEESDIKIRIPL